MKVFCAAFMCLQFQFVIFCWKDFGTKAAHKMWLKLTTVCQRPSAHPPLPRHQPRDGASTEASSRGWKSFVGTHWFRGRGRRRRIERRRRIRRRRRRIWSARIESAFSNFARRTHSLLHLPLPIHSLHNVPGNYPLPCSVLSMFFILLSSLLERKDVPFFNDI